MPLPGAGYDPSAATTANFDPAAVPLPGSRLAETAAMPSYGDEVPFSDDFGEVPTGQAPSQLSDSFFPDIPEAPDAPTSSFDVPAPSSRSAAFDFGAPGAGDSPGFDPDAAAAGPSPGLDAFPPGPTDFGAPAPAPGGFDFGAPAPAPAAAPGGFDFDAPPPPAAPAGFDFDAAPPPPAAGFDFSAPAPAASKPPDDLAFDFNAPPPPSSSGPASVPSFGEVDLGGPAPAADHGLEFDPSAPKRAGDDLEADLSAALPAPSASKPAGPADGLEMLSFIDDTAKDAGAPAGAAPVRRFHIKRKSGKVFGPFEEAVIVKMLEEAQLLGNEEISIDTEAWTPIGSEPVFQTTIAKLMESPGRASTQAQLPQVDDKAKGPSMEKLKQLYEGRMASVAVVESRAPVSIAKRLPLIFAAVAAVAVVGTGVFAGVATPYGWFFLKKIFPARIKPDTREHGYVSQARAGLLKDTFKSLKEARDSAAQALAVKEYPEARAVWNQAVYALQRRYGAAGPGEVGQADAELSNIELLGEKHIEVLKAQAAGALVRRDADQAISLTEEALARQENQDDPELHFLRAEAYLLKKEPGKALPDYQEILKKDGKSARALHALGTIARQKGEIDEAIGKYDAALTADADHVSSGIELAELQLVNKRDKAKGDELLQALLTKQRRADMAPAELSKALALEGEALVVDGKLTDSLPVFEEALKADPKNAFSQARMARVLTTLNQPEKALPLYRDAASAAPDNLDYTEGYLSCLILLGKMDEANKAMTSANARFPGNAMLSYLSGRVTDALDDTKSAEDGYKRAIAADPTITDAYLFLSRLYVRMRRFNDAAPILEQGLTRDAKNAALHVGMGELAFHERELERAEKEFKEANELNPMSSEAYRGLSRVALETGKADLALAHIEKALEINPRLQGGRLQKGMALWKLQRLDEAVQELQKAREEEPRNTQVIVTLGAVEFEQGKLNDSLGHLLSAIQSEPSHADGNFYLARVKNASRDHSQATEAIKRALESDPKNPVYRYWYGRILADARKSDEAIVEFRAAIEINPKYADALETLGRIFVDRNQLKEAVESFEKALAVDPGRNTARAAMGDAHTKLEDWDGAVKAYTAAIEADPENPGLVYAYFKLGQAYREKGTKAFPKAVEWMQKAAKVDPKNAEIFKELGYLQKDLKKPQDAMHSWKKYLEITTDEPVVRKVVEDDLSDLEQEEKGK